MKPGDWAAWAAVAALLPFAAIVLTSFIKVSVVLTVLRGAFGPQPVVPKSVVVALALLLSAFVMAPVLEKSWDAAQPALGKGDAASVVAATAKAREPLREFLAAHAPTRERQSFLELQRHLRPPEERAQITDGDLIVVAPAFAVGELKAAFQMGFLLLLPFLVLELVVASILTGLGMRTLDPRAVALPFKLLLFVVADGWHLLARGLVQSYG